MKSHRVLDIFNELLNLILDFHRMSSKIKQYEFNKTEDQLKDFQNV